MSKELKEGFPFKDNKSSSIDGINLTETELNKLKLIKAIIELQETEKRHNGKTPILPPLDDKTQIKPLSL